MADSEKRLVDALVTANRILANESILDMLGHVSVRSERNPQEFLLSCSRSPANVAARDIIRYRLDGSQVTKSSEKPYAERTIHGALYQARNDVQAVCHGHSDSILSFAVTGEAIRPVIHVGTMFWNGVGWFDQYGEGGNMLVSSAAEGHALAQALGDRSAVLLANHGFAVAGANLIDVVMMAVYLDKNAAVQSAATLLGTPRFIEEDEARRASKVFQAPAVQERAWGYWLARLPEGWRRKAGLAASGADRGGNQAKQRGARKRTKRI